jgi:drug/metabolite transporter (DMT)-like permease
MIAGILLAGVSALGTNLGFLLEHRGARDARPIEARHPLRSAASLFRSKWWCIGWLVALAAWLLHVGALSLAPLSLVQAVICGGLVFLAVLGERWFGFRLGRRQWGGLVLTAAGLAILGLTQGHSTASRADYSQPALIAVESALLTLGSVLVLAAARGDGRRGRQALLLGAAAGSLFGVSDIAIKYLSAPVLASPLALLSPWTAAALAAGVVAFYASARGFQLGAAVEVITLTSVAANLTAVIGGVLVFHDPVGAGALAVVGRAAAFSAVIAGAALVPAPVRAGRRVRRGDALPAAT